MCLPVKLTHRRGEAVDHRAHNLSNSVSTECAEAALSAPLLVVEVYMLPVLVEPTGGVLSAHSEALVLGR